jgi:hopanoid-associated phosphorylase
VSAGAPNRIIAAVGLVREARIAQGQGVHAVIGGGDVAALGEGLRRAIAQGASGIISFGIAGGLDPTLKSGTCIVGSAVRDGQTRIATDPVWSKNLQAKLPKAIIGDIAGLDWPAASVKQKKLLLSVTGALAVDMESHVAGRIAAEMGLPFAILRVVCDPASRDLPHAALAGMRRDGTTDVEAVLKHLLRNPSQLGALIALANNARAAFSVLKRRRKRAGPKFGLG